MGPLPAHLRLTQEVSLGQGLGWRAISQLTTSMPWPTSGLHTVTQVPSTDPLSSWGSRTLGLAASNHKYT